MDVAFSNTLRSLEAERFNLTWIALLLAIVLLVAWDVWFLFGQVARYETAPIAQVTQGGDVIAQVPAAFLDHLDYGEQTLLHVDGVSSAIRATVVGVDAEAHTVRLWIDDAERFLPDDATGEVEFAVAYTTPIAMLLKAAGLTDGWFATP